MMISIPRILGINFLILLILLSGCTNQEKKTTVALEKEVMAIHDDAMAKMGYMHELEMQLQKPDRTAPHESRQDDYTDAIQQLQNAHAAMMEWMRQYRKPSEEIPYPEQRSYLQIQKEKILHVQRLTNEAVAKGEALVKQK